MKQKEKTHLRAFVGQLEEMKSKIEIMHSEGEEIHSEMESAFDSKSEKWQESEVGEGERGRIDCLQNTNSHLDDIMASLESAISELAELTNEE